MQEYSLIIFLPYHFLLQSNIVFKFIQDLVSTHATEAYSIQKYSTLHKNPLTHLRFKKSTLFLFSFNNGRNMELLLVTLNKGIFCDMEQMKL